MTNRLHAIEELLDKGKPDQALTELEKEAPETALVCFLCGRALFEIGRVADGAAQLRRAVELEPVNARYHGALATVLLRQGHFEEARERLLKSLELDPKRIGSYFDLIYGQKVSEMDLGLITNLEAQLVGPAISNEDRQFGEYAMGKAWDDLGDYEKAIKHFDRANDISKGLALEKQPFDHRQISGPFDKAEHLFTREFLQANRSLGNKSDKPILIIGMMRSGTTLIEQILSSHSDVAGGGELFFWMRRGVQAVGPQGTITPQHMAQIQQEYLHLLEGLGEGKKHVTDKMPQNFLVAGLIHLAFPNARIINCLRNPADTCLSIYFTPNTSAPAFLHDKSHIAEFYGRYLRLMDLWRNLIPQNRLMDVTYEEIVEDKASAAKRILEFCDLPWNESVLTHEANTRSVATASLWQVRQPLYKSSMERWKNYEPWIPEFTSLLKPCR